ncbi:MAG TPA: acyltransferase, partial [Ilumatobacteraceae bacterium]|nr:acyltransferase [Ilumatobacteraceae bacterium]
RAFYIRRAFRILPIFYCVLALAVIATWLGVLTGHVDVDATASQLFHYFNFYAITHDGYNIAPGTGVYWSLAIEEHFYVFFPLALVLLRKSRLSQVRQGMILLVGCAVVLLWRLFLVYGEHSLQLRTYYGTDTRLDGLLFGCAAALIASPALDRHAKDGTPRQLRWTSWPVGAAGLGIILFSLVFRDEGFRETVRYTIQSVAIVACLRYVIVSASSPAGRLLNAKPVAWFGRMSYGFYLVHQVIISGLQEHISSRAVLIITSLALSTAAAWMLHLAIERPAGRLRSRILRSPWGINQIRSPQVVEA